MEGVRHAVTGQQRPNLVPRGEVGSATTHSSRAGVGRHAPPLVEELGDAAVEELVGLLPRPEHVVVGPPDRHHLLDQRSRAFLSPVAPVDHERPLRVGMELRGPVSGAPGTTSQRGRAPRAGPAPPRDPVRPGLRPRHRVDRVVGGVPVLELRRHPLAALFVVVDGEDQRCSITSSGRAWRCGRRARRNGVGITPGADPKCPTPGVTADVLVQAEEVVGSYWFFSATSRS